MTSQSLFKTARSVVLSGATKLSSTLDSGWSPSRPNTCVEHPPLGNGIRLLRLFERLSHEQSAASLVKSILIYAFPPPPSETMKIPMPPSKTTAVEGFDVQVPVHYALTVTTFSMVFLAIISFLCGISLITRRPCRFSFGQSAEAVGHTIRPRPHEQSAISPSITPLPTMVVSRPFRLVFLTLPRILSTWLFRGVYIFSRFVSFLICLLMNLFLVSLLLGMYFYFIHQVTPGLAMITTAAVLFSTWFILFPQLTLSALSAYRATLSLTARIWNYCDKTAFVLKLTALARLIPNNKDWTTARQFIGCILRSPSRSGLAFLTIAIVLTEAFLHTLPYQADFVPWILGALTWICTGLCYIWNHQATLATLCYVKVVLRFLERLIIRILVCSFNASIAPLCHRAFAWLLQLSPLRPAIYFPSLAGDHIGAIKLFVRVKEYSSKTKIKEHVSEPGEVATVTRNTSEDTEDEQEEWNQIITEGVVQSSIAISDLYIFGQYGKGGFGSVDRYFLPFDRNAKRSEGIILALKVCRKEKDDNNRGTQLQSVVDEARILSALQESSIFPKFYGLYESPVSFGLLMAAYNDGTLSRLLDRAGALRLSVVQRYSNQLLSGIAYLHQRGIVHRDIKPCNLLLRENDIVITDFGLSHQYPGDNYEQLDVEAPYWLCDVVGTRDYAAPEICLGHVYTCTADYWSCGVTIHEMFSLHYPKVDMQRGLVTLCKAGALCDPTIFAFLTKILAFDPSRRPKYSELINDPFFALMSND